MADDDSSTDKVKQLEDRLNYLETVARDSIARLYAIERQLGLVFHAVPRELKPEGLPQRQPAPPGLPAAAEELKPTSPSGRPAAIDEPGGLPVDQPAPPPTKSSTGEHQGPIAGGTPRAAPSQYGRALGLPPQQGTSPIIPRAGDKQSARGSTPISIRRTSQGPDLESRIGGSWFNRIGVFAIFLGVAFFLKYAVDREWIGPTGRVLIGAAIGIAFLIGGERLRKRYASYAYGLTGGGIAVLYATVWFASFKQYNLLPPTVAFGLMAAVTATASLLAARYGALPIAVLGLIGGFLTPILLSTGVDNESGLFSYIAMLDLGVLALAYSKQWRSLNYLAFIATVFMFGAWLNEWYLSEKLWTTIFFLTLFFIIFALLAVLYNVVNRRPTGWLDLAMVFSNALLYFGTSYELLDQHAQYRRLLGGFAVLVAAFYLGLGYLTYRRDRDDNLLIFTFLGLGFLFSVLAVPIQFEQHWITMGWAVEGAVMTWIGLRANDRTSRYAALVVFFIAISHWALSDVHDFAYLAPSHFVPLLNRRALSCAVLVAAMAASALFYKRYGEKVEERSSFTGLLTLAANGLAIALLTIDANDYFEQKKAFASGRSLADSLSNSKALTLTALWTIYGAGMLFVGVTRRLRALRFLALALLGGAIVKVLLVDLYYYDASWHELLVNQTFAAFALLVAALALGAWLYARRLEADDEERDIVVPLLISGANVLAIIALSAEVWGHFARIKAALSGSEIDRIENTKQFVLSAVWTIYGAAALLVGIKRGTRALRIGALMLLAFTTAKVLVVDLSYYNSGWHTLVLNQTFAAFALLVYVLASSAGSYAHTERIDDDERSAIVPVLVASANLLALVALSAEALGYYAAKIRAGDAAPGTLVDLRLAQQLSLSLVWAIYGGAMLAVGIARRSKLLRMMALALLGLTIFKVFLFDLSSLEKLYRIISFIVLGAILLAVSFLYQRYRQRTAESIEEPRAPVTADSQ
ncbi:MAG TPA: DUF2339 domain-containing protein [Blastocatellia bacterium]|nr:DUF2339 domain-containing protein [Blastocatellia bacterium]